MNNRTKNHKEEKNNLSRKLSPLTKITNQSRPFSRVQSVNAIRKKPWNKRFIYNKIQEYDSTKDKNVIYPKKLRVNSVKNNVFDKNYITYQQSKMYQTYKNIIKPFNRAMSGFFSHYSHKVSDFGTNRNIIPPSINSTLNKNNSVKNNNINLKVNMSISYNDENLNAIRKQWNELNVLGSYRELFIIIYSQLPKEEKEQIYKKEIDELNQIKNDIKTLKYLIDKRNEVLKDLYSQNKKLKVNPFNDPLNEEILTKISNLIENLRDRTVDVCYAMKKFKNDINNINDLAKYNIDILANKYKFDKNYLIKMKNELSFLKEGNAKLYFNLNNETTPFLLKASDNNMKMGNTINTNNTKDKDNLMRIVPLNEDIKEHINQCNYYIYQELIAYQLNISLNKNKFRGVSPLKSKNFYTEINNYINKENDISPINLKNNYINESNAFRKINKNIFSDNTDINNIDSTNYFINQKLKNIQNGINQRISERFNKDLFSQKLLSGYMINDFRNNLLIDDDDEKVHDEENEEEEEEEEKSMEDITKNENNDLIEENKDETDNKEEQNNNSNNNIVDHNEKNNDSNNKNSDINNKNNDTNNKNNNVINENQDINTINNDNSLDNNLENKSKNNITQSNEMKYNENTKINNGMENNDKKENNK